MPDSHFQHYEEPDAEIYAACMEEIKLRQGAIKAIISKAYNTPFEVTNIEFIALQFRKIFELIVLGGIATHRHAYEEVRTKFEKDWRIADIIPVLKSINLDFYPKPIDRIADKNNPELTEHKIVLEGYLTLSELLSAHGKLGDLLHARNPYKKPIDYPSYHQIFIEWLSKIVRLLNNHQIILDSDNFLYVGMASDSTGMVHYNIFVKQN